jgi:hypothetical protein
MACTIVAVALPVITRAMRATIVVVTPVMAPPPSPRVEQHVGGRPDREHGPADDEVGPRRHALVDHGASDHAGEAGDRHHGHAHRAQVGLALRDEAGREPADGARGDATDLVPLAPAVLGHPLGSQRRVGADAIGVGPVLLLAHLPAGIDETLGVCLLEIGADAVTDPVDEPPR